MCTVSQLSEWLDSFSWHLSVMASPKSNSSEMIVYPAGVSFIEAEPIVFATMLCFYSKIFPILLWRIPHLYLTNKYRNRRCHFSCNATLVLCPYCWLHFVMNLFITKASQYSVQNNKYRSVISDIPIYNNSYRLLFKTQGLIEKKTNKKR